MTPPHEDDSDDKGLSALLSHSDFLKFLTLRVGMVAAIEILTVAVGWHIYLQTGSVLNLGLIGLARFLPAILLVPVTGYAADRLDRRLIIGVCMGLHVVAAIGLGLFFLTAATAIWPAYSLLMLHGAAHAFSHPAMQATLPSLVPRALFSRAVATVASMTKVGQLGGPALAGILIATIDKSTYFVASGLFVLAGLAVLTIRTSLRVSVGEPFGPAAIFGGIRHILNRQIVLAPMVLDLTTVLFGSVMGLLPVYAADILQSGPESLGILRAMPGVGALLAGLWLARYGLGVHIGRAFHIALAVFGVSILVFSLSTVFVVSLAALLVYGATDMVNVYIRQTLVQLETPENLRGRVSAVNSVSIIASNQLGDFRAGTMAAFTGTVPAVAFGGATVLALTALSWRLFPVLRDRVRL